jgi:hypothetical protein
MPHVFPSTSAADYSRLEQTLFTRTRLRRLTLVVVGAGALGNEVARILGLLAPARVVVVDPDVVEPSNLPRSSFFWSGQAIGRNKASALIEAAGALFPDTEWTGIGSEIADVGFRRITDADLLFSCVDSDLSRLEIAYVSTKLRIPSVDGGLGRQNYSRGRVTYFPATADRACYGCMLSPRTRRELLELWHANVRPCAPVTGFGENDLVSTPTMAAVVGALQVEFGLRNFFQNREDHAVKSNTLDVSFHPDLRMSGFTTSASIDCPFHDPRQHILRPLPRSDCTMGDFLQSTAAEFVLLDWPVCTEAKCLGCERKWSPMLRLAALRRRGCCPACGSKRILELQTIRAIGSGSAWIGLTPSALGLPEDHLYTVQLRSNAL